MGQVVNGEVGDLRSIPPAQQEIFPPIPFPNIRRGHPAAHWRKKPGKNASQVGILKVSEFQYFKTPEFHNAENAQKLSEC